MSCGFSVSTLSRGTIGYRRHSAPSSRRRSLETRAMPDQAKAALVGKSKIGIELTEEQCGILSDLVEVREYADGDVVVPEGAVG